MNLMLDGCVSSVMMLRLGNNLIQVRQGERRCWNPVSQEALEEFWRCSRLLPRPGSSLMLPEHGLDVDDGLGVCHVVLLSAHRALFVHHHQVVSVDDSTLEQVVQAGPGVEKHTRTGAVRS